MPEWLETGLTFTVVGLTIVFTIQVMIALTVALLGRLDARWQKNEQVQSEKAEEKAPTIDATTLVLIAASVATVIEGRHRIRSVRLLPLSAPSSPWSSQGRATLQGSHVFVKKNNR